MSRYIGRGIFDFSISGSTFFVDDISSAIGKCTGKIIVLRYSSPDIVLLLKDACGVICEVGGITCHLSLLALEMGVPCAVGVEHASTIANGTKVSMISMNGRCEINEINTI